MNTSSTDAVQAALEYAALGWRVIPLHSPKGGGGCTCSKGKSCKTVGKHPRFKAWQKVATTDEKIVAFWWKKWPTANVGVVFGEETGLVDAECDTPEEEKTLLELFGGDLPITVCYKSSRGKHWLFRWRSDLPLVGIHHVGKLGLRLGNDKRGAYSVFPPSVHPSGVRYSWIVSPDESAIAEISDEVQTRLWNWNGESLGDGTTEPARRSTEHWERILKGVPEGSRDSSMISYIGKLLRTAVDLNDETAIQVIYESVQAVNERNQPPLPADALRKDFLSILKTEQNRRTTEEVRPALRNPPEGQLDPVRDLKGMRLVIVRSDPPQFELHAAQFSNAEKGCLSLSAEQLVSARAIKIAALKQADYPLPKTFVKLWDGTAKEPGLYEKLVFHADDRDAPREQKRRLVVAELLWTKLQKAVFAEKPDPGGNPKRMADDSIVFGFTSIWQEFNLGADRVTRTELSNVLEKIGVRWLGHKRFKRLTKESLILLDALLQGEKDIPQ